MNENSTFLAVITINACIIPLIATLLIGRKLYFNQKIDDIEIRINLMKDSLIECFPLTGTGVKKEDEKGINEKLYQEIIELNEKIKTTTTKEYYITAFEILSKIDEFSLSPVIGKNFSFSEQTNKQTIEDLYTKTIVLDYIFHQIHYYLEEKKALLKENIASDDKTEDLLSSLKYYKHHQKNTSNLFLEQKSKLTEIKNEHKNIDFIKKQERKFFYKRIYFLILFELLVGIFIPMMMISNVTYGEEIVIFSLHYDKSILYALTLGSISLLPYFFIIFMFLASSYRRTTDTPST